MNGLDIIRTAAWALMGAVVLLFVFFFAIGGIDPSEAWVLTIVVAVLATLWIVHFWLTHRGREEVTSRTDRERRGF